MRDIARWTKYFLEKGYSLSESRVKARSKLTYLQECETLKPSANKVDNGMYQK